MLFPFVQVRGETGSFCLCLGSGRSGRGRREGRAGEGGGGRSGLLTEGWGARAAARVAKVSLSLFYPLGGRSGHARLRWFCVAVSLFSLLRSSDALLCPCCRSAGRGSSRPRGLRSFPLGLMLVASLLSPAALGSDGACNVRLFWLFWLLPFLGRVACASFRPGGPWLFSLLWLVAILDPLALCCSRSRVWRLFSPLWFLALLASVARDCCRSCSSGLFLPLWLLTSCFSNLCLAPLAPVSRFLFVREVLGPRALAVCGSWLS